MKKTLFCLIGLWLTHPVWSQGDAGSNTTVTGQLWNEFNTVNAVNERLSFEASLELNTGSDTNSNSFNILNRITQYGAIGFVNYYLTPRLKLSVGVAAWHTTEAPEAAQFAHEEWRNSYQLIHYIVVKKATITNKVRYEQRFVEGRTGTYDFIKRVRYAPRLVYALNGNVIREKTFYALLWDELFFNLNVDPILKINSFNIGLGYSFTADVQLEVTYTSQFLRNVGAPNEHTNAIGIKFCVNNLLNFEK